MANFRLVRADQFAAEYPQIAEHIREAIEEVYVKQPKQALDDAAKESARVLGW